MRKIMLLVMVSVCLNSFSQTKVVEKLKTELVLTTLTFEVVESVTNDKQVYYKYVLTQGYKYPTIKQGFYQVNIFEDIDGLIKLYEELINVSKLEDGDYKVCDRYNILKVGNKLKFMSTSGQYGILYKRIKGDILILENDLLTLKSLKK